MSADEMKYAFFIYMCAVVARSIRGAGVAEVKGGWRETYYTSKSLYIVSGPSS